jgi:hypothetical protein
MAAPGALTWDAQALIDAHTAVLDLIDAGTGAGKIKLYTAADSLLATLTLTDPAGTVHGTTGQLTLTLAASQTGSADGTAAWAEVTDSDDNNVFSCDVSEGTSAVSGELVLNSASIVNGGAITAVTLTIG